MKISRSIESQLENASWIRRMFEEGARLKKERGADNVYDFTLGNPDVEPPPDVLDALARTLASARLNSHGYMPNPGFMQAREAVAGQLRRHTGLPFVADDIFMTVGSAGACNVILKSILDPGDEVIVLLPCFSEYQFYISNHSGRMVQVETGDDFLPGAAAVSAAITPRTKAIFLNTPNNPTGRVYPESALRELGEMLGRQDHEILVISDEPYKHLVYDGLRQPEVSSLIPSTVVCNSWSKSQALAGERIGYLALSPRLEGRQDLRRACAFTNRTLGFINAPAIWQLVESEALDAAVDVSGYERKRDLLCGLLTRIGYEVRKPEGTFYVFMKTPIPDDIAFVRMLAREGVLGVPGTGFGRSGYLRLSLTVPEDVIRTSEAGFAAAFHAVQKAIRPTN